MKKAFIAIAIILLILMNTIAYLVIYKKYNDVIDYFNQDSQLTAERLNGLDARVRELGAKADDMSAQFDSKAGFAQERITTAFVEMRKEFLSKIGSLESDIAAIKQKISATQNKKK